MIQITPEKIMDKLYKAYGTDSGILFGIRDRSVVDAIIKFTLTEVYREEILELPIDSFGE